MALKKASAKPTGALKRLLDTKKVDTRVVGRVERMLMAKTPGEGRRQDVLHPSELAKTDHCPLADYYRLVACDEGRPLPKRASHGFRTEVIFSEGHEYHRKWQSWLTELGVLEGMWLCPSCDFLWWAISPTSCQRCNHVGWNRGEYTNMIYREVPLKSKAHRISGHADGKVGTGLLEVKSIGEGTIRIEAPTLYRRNTKQIVVVDDSPGDVAKLGQWKTGSEPKSWVDMRSLWDGVKRPFPSHLRQADIYMVVARLSELDIDHMVFIYENKANGGSKEFLVPYSEERSVALLEVCLDVVWAVEKRRPPSCPHSGCVSCRAYENEDTTDGATPQAEEPASRRAFVRSAGPSRGTGLGAARATRRGLTGAAG